MARREAALRNTTLTALVEEGLRLVLRKPLLTTRDARVVLPVSRARGGLIARADLKGTRALPDRMDRSE